MTARVGSFFPPTLSTLFYEQCLVNMKWEVWATRTAELWGIFIESKGDFYWQWRSVVILMLTEQLLVTPWHFDMTKRNLISFTYIFISTIRRTNPILFTICFKTLQVRFFLLLHLFFQIFTFKATAWPLEHVKPYTFLACLSPLHVVSHDRHIFSFFFVIPLLSGEGELTFVWRWVSFVFYFLRKILRSTNILKFFF